MEKRNIKIQTKEVHETMGEIPKNLIWISLCLFLFAIASLLFSCAILGIVPTAR